MKTKTQMKTRMKTRMKKKSGRNPALHAYTIPLLEDDVKFVREATHVDAVAPAVRAYIRMGLKRGGRK